MFVVYLFQQTFKYILYSYSILIPILFSLLFFLFSIHSSANHDLDCVRLHTRQECGSTEAADFKYNYEKKRLLPLLVLIRCDLTTNSKYIYSI